LVGLDADEGPALPSFFFNQQYGGCAHGGGGGARLTSHGGEDISDRATRLKCPPALFGSV
jgi:hypothetical protein